MTKTVIELIAEVMAEVTSVSKGDRNDFHKFMFRGIDRVINSVGPALRAHRVLITPKLLSLSSRDVLTEKGKTSREVTVKVRYTAYGPAGDSMVFAEVPGEAQDTGDKAVSKAMSVAYRTALIQALTIPTDERDPDSQSYTRPDDVLTVVKQQVMAAAKVKGWDVERLAANFAEWRDGEDIREADVDTLREYAKALNPPRKAQRQPVDRPNPEPVVDVEPPPDVALTVWPEPALDSS